MDLRRLSQRIIIGVLIVLCGLVFLLDAFDIAFAGVINKWYLVITITIALIALAIALINKSEIFFNIALILAGIYLACNLAGSFDNITTFHTWPIITIMMGIGIFSSGIINKRRVAMLSVGGMLVVLSTLLLVGLLMGIIEYTLPAVIILIGLTFIIYSIIAAKRKRGSTIVTADETDYYIRPSSEKAAKAPVSKEDDTISTTVDSDIKEKDKR